MLRRPGRLVVAAGLVLLAAMLVAPDPPAGNEAQAATAGPDRISVGALVTATADRGRQIQLRPPPPPPGCRRVAIIGDSLTANGQWWHREELDRAGFVSHIDAQPSRRIPASVRAPYSGVAAALAVRASWGDADCWVIGLGSNDLIFGGGVAEVAASLIDEQLRAVTPGADVWWVNVDYHRDPAVNFDFPGATAVFNRVLAERAAVDPSLRVLDWYSYAEANPQWFFDPVHVDGAGSLARARFVVSALPR